MKQSTQVLQFEGWLQLSEASATRSDGSLLPHAQRSKLGAVVTEANSTWNRPRVDVWEARQWPGME